jgi:hypothetical protein
MRGFIAVGALTPSANSKRASEAAAGPMWQQTVGTDLSVSRYNDSFSSTSHL